VKAYIVQLAAAFVAALVLGCGGDQPQQPAQPQAGQNNPPAATQTSHTGHYHICVKCGQIEGTEVCCKTEGVESCPMCQRHKGSPGCCKDLEGEHIEVCLKCGQIEGTADCCKEGAEACEKCGWVKGSALCCKPGVKTKAEVEAGSKPAGSQ
jgi:hypothetical protein